MADYKKTKTLSQSQAAYIAGLIDGEGTITLSKRHKNENRQLVISISNNEKILLDYTLSIIGAGKITCKKTYSDKHAPSFTYSISNRQAINLLDQVYVFLRSHKKMRAQLVLDKYIRLTPRNGKYTEQVKAEREIFVQKYFEIKP